QPFTTEQMINKLKENKLFFRESSSMKKCVDLLNTLGYYNLKYFIKNEFEKNEEKNFDSVYTLYEFDRYLSKQLYSLLNILEVHLRNLILEVYLIEIEDRELPPALFYLDKKIYFQKEGESYKITSKKDKTLIDYKLSFQIQLIKKRMMKI
ncbi:Abi family protein, partial [Staphylococcus pseudintermedius]